MSHSLETIVSRAKRKWFVYPWSDIYGGLANAWDYGPYGVQLKKNILDLRRRTFIQKRPDMIGLDANILMHPKVRETSGHVDNFDDPLIDDKNTGERFRADKIIEDVIWYSMLIDSIKLAKEKWIYDFLWKKYSGKEIMDNSETLRSESAARSELNKNIISEAKDLYIQRIEKTYWVTNLIPESRTFEQMHAFIVWEIPNNPSSKKEAVWTEVRKFQMMYYTYQWVVHDETGKIRMRPETAQGIFVNFRNVLDTTRMRVPFGIGQVGKAFRNEITPGNFLYRTREFEQMEIEYFVENDKEKAMEAFNMRKELSMDRRTNKIGLNPEKVKFREHETDELSHYSDGTFDVDYKFPWGWGELQGIAYRTDFDLKNHQESSGKNMQYADPYTGARYVPHVIEPSFGLSRTVLTAMLDAYAEEEYIDGNGKTQTRTVARFHPDIAPVKYAILPLIKKDADQVRIAHEIYAQLATNNVVEYDDWGAIWKRYRRQDEIGTPYCITVDHQTVEDGTVTLRHRDDMSQERVNLKDLV